MMANRDWAITYQDIMPIFKEAYIAVNGFSTSDLWPLNQDAEFNELEDADLDLNQPTASVQPASGIQPAAGGIKPPTDCEAVAQAMMEAVSMS